MTPIEISILQQLTQKIINDIEVLNDSDLIKELDIIWGLGTGGSGRDSSGNKTAFWGKGGTNPRFVFNPNGFNTHEKHPGVVILKGKKLLTMIRELTMTNDEKQSFREWIEDFLMQIPDDARINCCIELSYYLDNDKYNEIMITGLHPNDPEWQRKFPSKRSCRGGTPHNHAAEPLES